MFDIRRIDLAKLNSITKYPSIPTYHELGEKGVLQDKVQVPFVGRTITTEKVDGTNARIVCCPDGSILVGSREELLWERRDLIGNPSMGIVKALRERVEEIASRERTLNRFCVKNQLTVYFVEVYGHGIGSSAANDTKEGNVGVRLFDVMMQADFGDMFEWTPEKIAAWRERSGQNFVAFDSLADYAKELDFEIVPVLLDTKEPMPTDMDKIRAFLQAQKCHCKLDATAAGVPEGVVVRTPDRAKIAKLRREDYERAVKGKK